ncbi:MAG: methionyl-tRNA formyltransferase [Candidatus Eisenbacteria bacterium]|nr:methionyl-tRNA formyltransferase [Candidatus Eisenbacteria bacterium]
MALKTVFLGTPAFAAASLEALVGAGMPPLLVVTRQDQPRGRGLKLQPSDVRACAERLGLPVATPRPFHDPAFLEQLRGLQPDVFAIVAYGVILKEAALRLPRLGCINVHASLLPRWRGVSPIAWQILSGDAQAGVTTQWIDAGVDTGQVIHRDAFPMPPDATTGTLTEELARRGAELLVRTLREVEAGSAPRETQDPAAATLAPRFGKDDGRLDWTRSAAWLERAARAFDPWPGLRFRMGEGAVRVRRAAVAGVAAAPGDAPHAGGTSVAGDTPRPGTVLRVGAGRVVVAAGEGALELVEVQPDGKRAMPADAWARGRGVGPGGLLASGVPPAGAGGPGSGAGPGASSASAPRGDAS